MSTITVTKNGVIQVLGTDYTITGNNVVFAKAPAASDKITIRKETPRTAIETSFKVQQISTTELTTQYLTSTTATSTFATATSKSTLTAYETDFDTSRTTDSAVATSRTTAY